MKIIRTLIHEGRDASLNISDATCFKSTQREHMSMEIKSTGIYQGNRIRQIPTVRHGLNRQKPNQQAHIKPQR
jgi:hypothetical protein